MSTKFLTRKEVADRYGVTAACLDRWVADTTSDFPRSMKIGRNRCFYAADLDAFDRRCVANGKFKSLRQAEALAERAVA
jgi:excisionase family DNA binding protein